MSNESLEMKPSREAEIVTICWLVGEVEKAINDATVITGLPNDEVVRLRLDDLSATLMATIGEMLDTGMSDEPAKECMEILGGIIHGEKISDD